MAGLHLSASGGFITASAIGVAITKPVGCFDNVLLRFSGRCDNSMSQIAKKSSF
jgi:hypothetical protein